MDVHEEKNRPWKVTAWNGIRFRAPIDWEPVSIGNRYLMIEDEAGPAFELKWNVIKGAFSHRNHLRRLAKNFRGKSGIQIQERPLSAEWEDALRKYERSGFLWTGKTAGGRGVMLYCPTCRQATLIQFYENQTRRSDRIYPRILRSFEDHHSSNETVWTVFDIRAVVPDRYRLKYHRFEPGRFEIAFESGRQKLTLYRWAPAGIALFERTLEQFAKMMVPMLQDKDRFHVKNSGHSVEFECLVRAPFWQCLKPQNRALMVRIWHEEKRNKILGVRIEANANTAGEILDTLSRQYETF